MRGRQSVVVLDPLPERIEGIFPFALQRACELTAARMVIEAYVHHRPHAGLPQWIAEFSPASLHGFIHKLLTKFPERRIL